jgi:hypothetical protein
VYRQTGPGGLPLLLRLSEGLGLSQRAFEILNGRDELRPIKGDGNIRFEPSHLVSGLVAVSAQVMTEAIPLH